MLNRDKIFLLSASCEYNTLPWASVSFCSPPTFTSAHRDSKRSLNLPGYRKDAMPSKKHNEDINQSSGYVRFDVRPNALYNWWQCTSIMRRLSFTLIIVAAQAALLSFCLSTKLFTNASSVAHNARTASAVTLPDLYEASIAELQDGLGKGHFTSEDLVKVSFLPFVCEMTLKVDIGILFKNRRGQLTRPDFTCRN